MSITYRLMPHLDALLRPERLIPAADIIADRKLIPDVGGIYGWWFDIDLPGIDSHQALTHGSNRLCYVGIAPRAPASGRASRGTLRKRIRRQHLGNRIGSSTLRRTLAALLCNELSLDIGQRKVGRRTRYFMSVTDERKLTDWLGKHASLSFHVAESGWGIEKYLIGGSSVILPLNIAGSARRSGNELIALRRGLSLAG